MCDNMDNNLIVGYSYIVSINPPKPQSIHLIDLFNFLKKERAFGFPKCDLIVYPLSSKTKCRCVICKALDKKDFFFNKVVYDSLLEESENFIGSAFARKKHLVDFVISGKLENSILIDELLDE